MNKYKIGVFGSAEGDAELIFSNSPKILVKSVIKALDKRKS